MAAISMDFSYKEQDGTQIKNKSKIHDLNNFTQVHITLFLDLPMIQLLPQADRKVP